MGHDRKMVKIGPPFLDVFGCVYRLGAHTVLAFPVLKGPTLPYIHAKYHWITPKTRGDTYVQKWVPLEKSKIWASRHSFKDLVRNGQEKGKI